MKKFLKVLLRECPGVGKQAQMGHINWDGYSHTGSCPDCGKARVTNGRAILEKHRKIL